MNVLESVLKINVQLDVIFPVHPRTRQRVAEFRPHATKIYILEPSPLSSSPLLFRKRPAVVITNSGGIQEETTYLKVPCLTFLKNTERPVTAEVGANILV
jgi:UDP-N-acetylglucosamine 2-epimerase (non-hydrolysing)